MGLKPLEFSDCLVDSPYFRDTLHNHEKELDKTSKAIKGLINDCRDVIAAAKNLSKAQRHFSKSLKEFKFESIGSEQTDDETIISQSLKEMGDLIQSVEDERDVMMTTCHEHYIQQLEDFRKSQFGCVKDGRKKFEKQTKSFYQSLEKHLNLKTKVNDTAVEESEVSIQMEQKQFHQASMDYVMLLQETQEKKKFEFVETLLSFMYAWLTFYHQGYEASQEFGPYMQDLQQKIQNTRESYEMTKEEANSLMKKMLEVRGAKVPDQNATKEGYLYLLEKKAFGTSGWTKQFCTYRKENKLFSMVPFNPLNSVKLPSQNDTMVLKSCIRRASDSIEKRFCFDITVDDRPHVLTLQALSEENRRYWLDAMDGTEPIYKAPERQDKADGKPECVLNGTGFTFVQKCVDAIETRGIDDQGLYRIVGVNSKVQKLVQLGTDPLKANKLDLLGDKDFEVKTMTSALKNYFRSLPEPLMTFKLHSQFIAASKKEEKSGRVQSIHYLVHKLPNDNRSILNILIKHLKVVSENHKVNLMNVTNLGVCFGPTLLRAEEETMAAIMDIKFCNIVAEILIENHDMIFESQPGDKTSVAESNGNLIHRPSSNLQQKRSASQAEYYNFSAAMSSATGAGPVHISSKPGGRHPTDQSPRTGSTLLEKPQNVPQKVEKRSTHLYQVRTPSSSPYLGRDHNHAQSFKARTLYACEAENDSELSFEPNQIITNVRRSREPGWMEGALNGKTGLIPENYVEILN